MLTILTQPSSTDLTTLAKVKQDLGITNTTSDALLSDLISQISDEIVRFTQRSFAKSIFRETLAGFGGRNLVLKKTPVLAVSQILLDDGPITDSRIEDPDAGILQRDLGWVWTAGSILGSSLGFRRHGLTQTLVGFVPANSELPRFQVDYTAGYSLPGDDIVAVVTVSVLAADNSFNDSASGFPVLAAGDLIRVSGFANAANNGTFTVATFTASKITVVETTLVDEGAGPTVSFLVRSLPGDLERNTIELVKSSFLSAQRDPTITSKKVGDLSIGYGSSVGSQFPPRVMASLTKWIRVV